MTKKRSGRFFRNTVYTQARKILFETVKVCYAGVIREKPILSKYIITLYMIDSVHCELAATTMSSPSTAFPAGIN